VKKVHDEAVKMLAEPEARARFAQLGLDTVGSSPDALAAVIKSDIAKWSGVIKEAGIKPAE
jgi:tripartite-type tricarboxylate transporter receptor subunit TctC